MPRRLRVAIRQQPLIRKSQTWSKASLTDGERDSYVEIDDPSGADVTAEGNVQIKAKRKVIFTGCCSSQKQRHLGIAFTHRRLIRRSFGDALQIRRYAGVRCKAEWREMPHRC